MASLRSLTVFTFIFLINFSQATYNESARSNLAVYWGQGSNQQRLLHFCQQSTIDILPIGFVNIFPAQGNGFPGDNFGNQCWGGQYVYPGPGNDSALNQLQSECPDLVADIPVCQSQYNKKIILSLGGGIETYGLTGAENGTAFADFMWGAFGPQTKDWLDQGLPRPFDGPNNSSVEVDGFDFDIEFPSADNQAGYIAMIQRLREHFQGASKQYLITGAPQCVVPDANMGQMITYAKFDIIWIQYYNTAQCSARNWVTANPNYTTTGVEEPSGFSFNAWETFLVGTESSDAKLYIGLPGGGSPTWYLTPTEASSLIKAYYCKPNFGGIMIWEATSAENNDVGCGETYYEAVKDILVDYSQDGSLSCVTPPNQPPPTSSKASCTVSSTTTSTSTSPTITPTPPCTEVYQVVSGEYCYLIWTEFNITEAQLYAWNPSLDTNCDLQVGQILCVAESASTSSSTTITGVSASTTSSSASATPTACTETYTVASGDSCYAIWTEFGITQAQLYAYNPTLDANCDLSIGQVLCVSESPYSTSSSTVSTQVTTTSSSASSSPTAVCTEYYTVVSGDYCYLIYTKFGITLAQLDAYNPSLDNNCDLSVGQVLCVSQTPISSTSTSTSTSTDSISTQVSITTPSASSTPTVACTETYTVVILCVSQSPISSSSSTLFSTSSTQILPSSSSSSPIISNTTSAYSALITSSITTKPLKCNADNCLRQLEHSSATAFCSTFTQGIITATTGLPKSVSMCQSDCRRISSACTCLGSSVTGSTLMTLTSSLKTSSSEVP
ncbi:carbohydrate-binding module family 50 protein [Stipitochalara longipes BDJ]|nr:carbohydrate-binding module family 50 protein [Stipitochalara longipes BDJ]